MNFVFMESWHQQHVVNLSLSLTGLDQSLPSAGDHGAGADGVGRQHRPVEEGEELIVRVKRQAGPWSALD